MAWNFKKWFNLLRVSSVYREDHQEVPQVKLIKIVKCGSEFTYRLWGQASYWSMFITCNMFMYPLFLVGGVWFKDKRLGRSRKSQVSHKGLFQICTRFFNWLNSCPKQLVLSQCSLSVKSESNCGHSDDFFFNVAVNRSTRAGKRLFVKAGTSTVYVK